ncbi:MAG: non-ribosomal peptide synthase [Rivularia sp. (in: Bacteria)]|nr:non-ribosomal peptide synthase [Rivularia sp. MS3]
MSVSALLENLKHLDVKLWVDNDKLKINSPKGALTQQLKSDIASQKHEIIRFLNSRQDSTAYTATGLSLQTIGRLIGGFCPQLSTEFKPPIIEPEIMAKQLKVSFRPLPKRYDKQAIKKFREELKLKLEQNGVNIIDWELATKDFRYQIHFPLTKWNKSVTMKVVKDNIDAVIDVERPHSFIGKIKSLVAEKVYQGYSNFVLKNNKKSVSTITKLIGWAEDNVMQRLEDPTSTQVVLLTEIDKNFVDSQIPYKEKISIGINTLVKTFSEIVIGVSDGNISILNMNLSDSIFSKDSFDNFVKKSLIPKLYVPIAPLPMSRFAVGKYNPEQSEYASKLVKLSQELAKTDLFPSGFQLSEIINRQSHRDIVDSIVNGRTGVSYGFVAYAEPPQFIGKRELEPQEWESLSAVAGFNAKEVRQNAIGRRYVKTKIKNRFVYKQLPDIWLVCSRSGANKTDLNLENDILRMGLKDKLYLELPSGIDQNKVDIKPSYDTYVMVGLVLSAALYTPELIENGAPMIHFHGYPANQWFHENEYYTGVNNPSVPCGTYESGVFNFLGIHNLADSHDSQITLATLLEPDHGTNIVTGDLDYLLDRLHNGIQQGQIELGGKHFASLKELAQV